MITSALKNALGGVLAAFNWVFPGLDRSRESRPEDIWENIDHARQDFFLGEHLAGRLRKHPESGKKAAAAREVPDKWAALKAELEELEKKKKAREQRKN
ncbi:MAG: hypothetical protein A2Z05_05205 [Chloroflexi bacterium RBG_16_60_22]|nr:MAG: hypothetical protein A2Z05_05205 [Chloroflexi bacterium RBG_16_60_22]